MVIYVEAVLLDNFCLDVLLAYSALLLTKEKIRRWAIILSALLGCGFALLIPLIGNSVFLKFAVLLLCTLVFTPKTSFRRYLITSFVYAMLSFCLCGIFSFLLGGTPGEGFLRLKGGGAVALLSVGALFFLYSVRQIRGLIRVRRHGKKFAQAEVRNCDKSVKLKALFDSGNLLTDKNGEGVVVTDKKKIRALGELSSFGEMKVCTASGSKMLELVKIPEIKIYSEEGENILTDVTAALSDLPDEYALILPWE